MTSRVPAAGELRAWRITKSRYADTAFDGEGAWRHGGRWNSAGTRVVYASESQALAVLELLVHLGNRAVLSAYSLIEVVFSERLVRALEISQLPAGWRDHPPPPRLQELGDRWARAGESAVLRVPSAICPGECNYLIRPDHADFAKLAIARAVPFEFDRRLVGGS